MKKPNEYVICILNLLENRKQTGIFFLYSDSSIEELSAKLGFESLKKQLNTKWELHITKIKSPSSKNRAQLVGMQPSIVSVAKKIIEKLKVENEESKGTLIIVPSNIG